MDINPSAVYNMKTAAVRLGITTRQVNKLLKDGRIAFTRIGEKVRKEFVITEAAIRAYEDSPPVEAPAIDRTPTKDHPWRTSPLGANSKMEFSEWELKSMFAELNRYRKERVFTRRRYWLQATLNSLRNGFRAGHQPA